MTKLPIAGTHKKNQTPGIYIQEKWNENVPAC
jgi:hypothetical protein